MKRVAFISIIFLGILAVVIGLSTYAWFTSQASNVDNVFASGELIIGVPNNGQNDGFIEAQNLFPGSSITRTLDVKNLGNIIFKYKVSAIMSSGDEQFFNKLDISIKKGEQQVYTGSIKDLNTLIGNLEANATETLTFTVSLPTDADNYYQGKFSKVNIVFDATQLENTLF